MVNTNQPFRISSDIFDGEILVNIKGFTNSHAGDVRESEYFSRQDRQGITWSIQVQGKLCLTTSRRFINIDCRDIQAGS